MLRLSDDLLKCTTTEELQSLLDKYPRALTQPVIQDEGAYALHLLVQKSTPDALALVSFALSKPDIDVNVRDREGATPLMYSHSLAVTDVLLKAGADAKATDNSGYTALHYLPERLNDPKEYRPVIDALIGAGASLSSTDSSKRTPIFRAETAAVAKAMLESNANPNVFDDQNLTPMHVMLNNVSDENIVDLLEAMFRFGANPDLQNETGTSPRAHAESIGRGELFNAALNRATLDPSKSDRLVDSKGSSCCTIA